jgi:predicted DNA-binding mobile mystery protein A
VSAIQRLQLDERLRPFRELLSVLPPPGGWLRTIREALGMMPQDLARRVGIARPTLLKIEQSEANGTVTLNTLRRVANAMDCELVCLLVPRKPLQQTLTNRAIEKAGAEVARIAHTMALEKQKPTDDAQSAMIQARVQELMSGDPRRLWEDD